MPGILVLFIFKPQGMHIIGETLVMFNDLAARASGHVMFQIFSLYSRGCHIKLKVGLDVKGVGSQPQMFLLSNWCQKPIHRPLLYHNELSYNFDNILFKKNQSCHCNEHILIFYRFLKANIYEYFESTCHHMNTILPVNHCHRKFLIYIKS